ncbi:MAG: hypothetical protein AAF196_07775 [Planctomycetota bacterium]
MSNREEQREADDLPRMSVADALELASRRSGRPIDEVVGATYVSAVQLEVCIAQDPDAPKAVRRWGPHWRVWFAGKEWLETGENGPAWASRLSDDDIILVFEDGAVMNEVEVQNGPELAAAADRASRDS